MPGLTIRKVSENRASCGLASLLSACQAISMAMTTVLPDAGRHLERERGRAGVRRVVGLADVVLDPGVAELLGDFGEVDERFQGLDLAEEQLALAVGVGPVSEQGRAWWG